MRKRLHCKKRIVIGLTGSFGSGKSTVAKIFQYQGAQIIDADKIAHSLLNPKKKIYKKIVNMFGKNILKKNKTIDRLKLARTIFNHKSLLRKINKIMHPEIIRTIKQRINSSLNKIIILDAPLLIEAGLTRLVDSIVVVKASRKEQMRRLIKRFSLSRQDILKRIKAQIPLEEKVRLADFVIDNSGTKVHTRKQVEEIRRALWKN